MSFIGPEKMDTMQRRMYQQRHAEKEVGMQREEKKKKKLTIKRGK